MFIKVCDFLIKLITILALVFTSLNIAYADGSIDDPKIENTPEPIDPPLNINTVNSLEKHISYYVLQQSVGSAMKDIGTQISIPMIIGSNVKGKVAAGKYNGTARKILTQMASDLNLHWYFDGRAIHVTNAKDAVMHVVQLNGFGFDTLERTLTMINLDTREFPMRHDIDNNLVIVYGPPKYVATIEVVAHHLANRARVKPSVIRG